MFSLLCVGVWFGSNIVVFMFSECVCFSMSVCEQVYWGIKSEFRKIPALD